MDDREFLLWIHEKLEYQHGENPSYDYMYKLRSIIVNLPLGQHSANVGVMNNSKDLRRVMEEQNETQESTGTDDGCSLEDKKS